MVTVSDEAIRLHKAGSVHNLPPTVDTLILIDLEAEGMGRMDFEREARVLADALWTALPAATIDALIAELFRRRANLLLRTAHP